MHRTPLATFGGNTSKTHDWFDAKSTEMRPVIETKLTALIVCKQSPSERNLQILRAAMSKVQQTARRYANEYWIQLSQDIQIAAITRNIRGMYDGIKGALYRIWCGVSKLGDSGMKVVRIDSAIL